jgi:hypothetical protein
MSGKKFINDDGSEYIDYDDLKARAAQIVGIGIMRGWIQYPSYKRPSKTAGGLGQTHDEARAKRLSTQRDCMKSLRVKNKNNEQKEN